MINKLNIIPEHYSTTFIKHLIVFALFFPVFYSEMGNAYYPDFILVNVFAACFLAVIVLRHDFTFTNSKVFVFTLTAILIVYDICALYINKKYLHWYSDQANVTVAFAFFIILLLLKKPTKILSDNVIRFFIHSIVISNIIGFVFYFMGYYGITFLNCYPYLIKMDPNYYETRFNWIYYHKSQYALMLVLFLALFFTYRKLFHNKWTFIASISVLFIGLIISHTYTSMIAAFFIPGGLLLDYIRSSSYKIKPKYFLFTLPIIGIIAIILYKISQERSIWTLGSRIPIWSESLHILKEHFYGIGVDFGFIAFKIPNLSFEVYNCHNLFMNWMLRFSVPVGVCYTLMFILILAASLKRNHSFLSCGIWIALLIPMCMDYSMLTTELTLFLFTIYCIFFHNTDATSKAGENI